jgi:hypothetical protein
MDILYIDHSTKENNTYFSIRHMKNLNQLHIQEDKVAQVDYQSNQINKFMNYS